MSADFKFTAFISYSHSDRKMVQWLHRALETYRIPKRLVGLETPIGPIPKKFRPFFCDREDLSASTDLSKSVRNALAKSKFLIVMCSPAAAKSKWVNQEILEFRKLRGKENILCLITGGEPGAGTAMECFPKSLRPGKGRFEPIAADARPEGDGKRLAKLKLVSGLLGLELDKLVQRETQRRQRQLAAVSVASVLGMVILSVLLFLAVDARREAEESRMRAEEKRAQAEELVEFMLGDLKEKLEPTGSLEILDAIGMQALGYYSALEAEELDEASLSRQSSVLLMLGEIEDLRGNLDLAKVIFLDAFKATEELLARGPENPDRIFDHSQSIYWLGYLDWRQGNLDSAEDYFQDYMTFAQRLAALGPDNQDWQIEVGYGHSNLGTLYFERGKFFEAKAEFEKAQAVFLALSSVNEDPVAFQLDLADSFAWLADAELGLGNLVEAEKGRQAELEIYRKIQEANPQNNDLKEAMMVTHRALGDLKVEQGVIKGAMDHLEAGLLLGEGLMELDPENTRWAYGLAGIYLDVAEVNLLQASFDEAKTYLNKAKALEEMLLARDESVLQWQVNLQLHSQLMDAAHALETGNLSLGLELAQASAAGLMELRKENSGNRDILSNLSYAYFLSGEAYLLDGHLGEAKIQWQKVVGLWEGKDQNLSLKTKDYLARAYWRLGNIEKAKPLVDDLETIGYRNPGFVYFWQKQTQ